MSDSAWLGRNSSFLLYTSNIVSTLAVALSRVEFCKARDPITYYAKSWRSRMKSWRLSYHIICFQDELSRYSDAFTSRRQWNQIFFLVFSLIYIYIFGPLPGPWPPLCNTHPKKCIKIAYFSKKPQEPIYRQNSVYYQCAGKRTFATPKPNPNPPKPSFFQKKTRSKVPKTQKTGCAYSEHYTK